MRIKVLALFSAAAVAAACSESASPTRPAPVTIPLVVDSAVKPDGVPQNHRTHLSGENEVFTPATPGAPTPADSHAQGQAIIQIAPDGQSFEYKLIASNIENAIMAHIHCGASTVNGPIVVWLYPSPTATGPNASGSGRHDGVLAEGTVISGAANHVRPTTNAACPGGVRSGADGFADVLERIREGNAYVNVHTNDGVTPTNQGPGDFPGGEIRGQIR